MSLQPIDTETPRTPGWWLQVLATELHNRRVGRRGTQRFSRQAVASSKIRPPLELLADYLKGDPPLDEDIHSGWSAPFRQYLRMGRMNVAPLLVSSTTNRMTIRDFRTAAARDELGDVEARKLMRSNQLRLQAREVHDHMLGLGDGYGIITPPDAARPYSLFTAESPMHCITAKDAGTRQVLAGLKMFRDEWDTTDWAYLFLPGEVWVARADVPATTLFAGRQLFQITKQWQWDTGRFDNVPGNEVAMVPFKNKDGVSELEGYLDTLDRINDKLFNEWWIGKIQAFRQRALLLADEGEDDEAFGEQIADEIERAEVQQMLDRVPDVSRMSQGELNHMFTSAPDGFWTLPIGAKLWESTPTDFRQLTESIKSELEWLASMKSLPLHTITPDAANGSAEGASTQKEEHIYVIEDRADRADGAWAKALSLMFLFQGDKERSDVTQIEPLWGPMERFSLSQKADAAQKLKDVLPVEAIQVDILQYSPADVVDRLRPLRAQDLLFSPLPTTDGGSGGTPSL